MNKIEKAKAILQIWEMENKIPDVAEVVVEALKLLIANEESKDKANAMDNMADEIRGMGKSDADVIEYFNEGSSAQQIAQELGMSIDQVEDIISKHEQ